MSARVVSYPRNRNLVTSLVIFCCWLCYMCTSADFLKPSELTNKVVIRIQRWIPMITQLHWVLLIFLLITGNYIQRIQLVINGTRYNRNSLINIGVSDRNVLTREKSAHCVLVITDLSVRGTQCNYRSFFIFSWTLCATCGFRRVHHRNAIISSWMFLCHNPFRPRRHN